MLYSAKFTEVDSATFALLIPKHPCPWRLQYVLILVVALRSPHACINVATFLTIFRRKASRPFAASNDKPTGTLPEDSATGSDTCGSRPIPATEVRESARA